MTKNTNNESKHDTKTIFKNIHISQLFIYEEFTWIYDYPMASS